MPPPEVEPVVGLEHLVGELGEAHAVRGLKPRLHRRPRQHAGHAEPDGGARVQQVGGLNVDLSGRLVMQL